MTWMKNEESMNFAKSQPQCNRRNRDKRKKAEVNKQGTGVKVRSKISIRRNNKRGNSGLAREMGQRKKRKLDHEKEKFDVEGKMQALTYKERRCLQMDIKIITLNIGGLRTSYKKESLKAMAHHLKFSIGIITETNLLDNEADALVIPGYRVMDKEGKSKHKGGVLILADENVACKKTENICRPWVSVDVCSILLYPTGEADYQIRITGVYIPPSAKMDIEGMALITKDEAQTKGADGQNISHLLVGDFNPNCWRGGGDEKYHEWIDEHGLWELSHPHQATFKTGSVLDKFILKLGGDIPDEWLPDYRGEDLGEDGKTMAEELMGEEWYPAVTFPERWIDDHHPVILGLHGKKQAEPKMCPSLKLGNLTPEEWAMKTPKCRNSCWAAKKSLTMRFDLRTRRDFLS